MFWNAVFLVITSKFTPSVEEYDINCDKWCHHVIYFNFCIDLFPFQFAFSVSASVVDTADISTIISTIGVDKNTRTAWKCAHQPQFGSFHCFSQDWKVGIKMCHRLHSSDMLVSTGCQDTHLSKILVHNIIKTYLIESPLLKSVNPPLKASGNQQNFTEW